MQNKYGTVLATASFVMLSIGTLRAHAATAAPAVPTLSDVLASSGITASGYVDASASYFSYSGSYLSNSSTLSGAPKDYDTFTFQQAGLTVARQPAAGFGGLIDVVATPYASVYVNNYAPDPHYYLSSGVAPGAPHLTVLQGYAQWIGGAWTVLAGKFGTLAGAEVYAPTGNTNVTRSLLFTFEPVTNTGVRATYAPSSALSLTLGVNNGWFNGGGETSLGPDKTLEAGLTVTPNKRVSWSLANYYGREPNLYGVNSSLELLDTVVTVTVSSALTVIGSADYGNVGSTGTSPSASWWGVAGYVNYQFNSQWRTSLRGEFFDDQDGYLTDGLLIGPYLPAAGAEKLKEITLTFGWDPIKNLEFRLEGRYDDPSKVTAGRAGASVPVYSRTVQSWLEALYHF
jgi:hypothetical protein